MLEKIARWLDSFNEWLELDAQEIKRASELRSWERENEVLSDNELMFECEFQFRNQ